MDKVTFITLLRDRDIKTLYNLVLSIWTKTGRFGEYLLVANTPAHLERLTGDLSRSKADGSYVESDPWVGQWNQSIYSLSNEDYHYMLLETIYKQEFRNLLLENADWILMNHFQFPPELVDYVKTNKINQ